MLKRFRKLAVSSHLAHCASDALQTVCGVGLDLDIAVIDFKHCPHGISLISAISMCREDLPVVVVVARDDEKHVEDLAYACGAVDCLHTPVAAAKSQPSSSDSVGLNVP